jgi:predicted DNA-binding transcriptional regulator AlpA
MQPAKRTHRFQLDRRAHQILANEPPPGLGHNQPPPDDDLLTPAQVAAWLGVSVQFLDAARARGDGPEFVRLGERAVRYQRAKVRKFLRDRAKLSAAGRAKVA